MIKYRLFFSNRTSDSKQVRELQDNLSKQLPRLPIVDVSNEVPFRDDWKVVATSVIKSCDMLVCIVGKDTYKSEPVDWEIREAYRLNKPILVTLMSESYQEPSACKELGIECIPWNASDVAGQIGEKLLPRALFPRHDWSTGVPQSSEISEQYHVMVESWEALIGRRQRVNTVYITANAALLAGLGVVISSIDKLGYVWAAAGAATLAFLGAALSFNWKRTIRSYGTLSKAKYKVVSALEAYMPAQMFDAEWQVLEANHYKSTTQTDQQTAFFFLLLFSAAFLISGGIAIGQFM